MDIELKRMARSFVPGILMVAVLWIIKIFEWKTGTDLAVYGLFPRKLSGLTGIVTSPFIHGDFEHLISNSVPLLVLSAGLFYFYRSLAYRVFIMVMLLGGFWLWLGGRPSYHIGASGVVYGITSFLFFSGVFRRDIRLMALSLLVVFLYGGMVWGIFPIFKRMSWEAHLFGALAGILMAVVYRREGPQRKRYSWEDEFGDDDDVPDGPDAYWRIPEQKQQESAQGNQPDISIHYIYKPQDKLGTDDKEN